MDNNYPSRKKGKNPNPRHHLRRSAFRSPRRRCVAERHKVNERIVRFTSRDVENDRRFAVICKTECKPRREGEAYRDNLSIFLILSCLAWETRLSYHSFWVLGLRRSIVRCDNPPRGTARCNLREASVVRQWQIIGLLEQFVCHLEIDRANVSLKFATELCMNKTSTELTSFPTVGHLGCTIILRLSLNSLTYIFFLFFRYLAFTFREKNIQ